MSERGDEGKPARRVDLFDVIAAVGLVLLAVGLVFVWWPLALVVPGAILVVVGLAGAILQGRG